MAEEEQLTIGHQLDNHETAIKHYLKNDAIQSALEEVDAAIKTLEDDDDEKEKARRAPCLSYWRILCLRKLGSKDEADQERERYRELAQNHPGVWAFIQPQ